MSSLSQFAPFAGGGIKSIQTGYVAVTGSSATVGTGEDLLYTNVTISSVNTAKSIPNMFGSGNRDTTLASVYSGQTDYNMPIVLPRLTSSTNLRLSVNANALGAEKSSITGRWYVVESN